MFRSNKYLDQGMTFGEASVARAADRAKAKAARAALALKVTTSPIAVAVAPLRADAMDAAETYAKKTVATVEKALEGCQWDRQDYAPYPRSTGMSRYDYQHAVSKYRLVAQLTVGYLSSRSPKDADPCFISPEAVAKFIAECRADAAAQYDKFVAKLVSKIGDCDSATLSGNHVWSFSELHVVKGATRETWRTQQITNCSVLGKYFPQWPSRQVKGR
jgi:hypothetical protein